MVISTFRSRANIESIDMVNQTAVDMNALSLCCGPRHMIEQRMHEMSAHDQQLPVPRYARLDLEQLYSKPEPWNAGYVAYNLEHCVPTELYWR